MILRASFLFAFLPGGWGGWHLPGGSSKYSQLGAVQRSSECLVYWLLGTIGHNQKQLVTQIRMEPENDQI